MDMLKILFYLEKYLQVHIHLLKICRNGRSYIGNNCYLENVILDKEVVVSDGRKLIGSKENPFFGER